MPTEGTISNCSESVRHQRGLGAWWGFEVSFSAEMDCKLPTQLPTPQHPRAHGAQLLQLRAPKPTCKELCHQGWGCTGLTALLISIPQQQNRAAVQLVGQPDAEKPLQGPEIPAQAPLQGSA